MRLFRVIIIFSSLFLLANCSTYYSQYTDNLRETDGHFINISKAPLSLNEHIIGATPGFLWNATQYLRFNLNKIVKFMLNTKLKSKNYNYVKKLIPLLENNSVLS